MRACMCACVCVVRVQKCVHNNNFCTHHFSQLTIGNAAPLIPTETGHTEIQHHHNEDYSTYHTYTDDYATSVTCGIKRKDGTTKLGRVGLEIIPAMSRRKFIIPGHRRLQSCVGTYPGKTRLRRI